MYITDILQMSTPELKMYLITKFKKECILGTDYIFVPGTNPICLVSHIDIVGSDKIDLEVRGNIIRNKCGILGADDKAGVYAMLAIWEHSVDKPSLLFTDKEECGGIGAKEASKNLNAGSQTRLLVELDRRGCNEYVTYDKHPKEVTDYIEGFGFVENWGSYSDISDLCQPWQIPAVNLSIGYYEQHTSKERLHLDEMNLTIDRVLSMINNPIKKRYALPVDQDRYDWELPYYSNKHTRKKADGYGMQECMLCASIIPLHKVHEVEYMLLCEDCAEYYYSYYDDTADTKHYNFL